LCHQGVYYAESAEPVQYEGLRRFYLTGFMGDAPGLRPDDTVHLWSLPADLKPPPGRHGFRSRIFPITCTMRAGAEAVARPYVETYRFTQTSGRKQ
jgi:hypothetical protein